MSWQYVGWRPAKLRLIFNNQKPRFRVHWRLSVEGRDKDDLVYRHFSDPVCHGLEDVSIKLIDRLSREESALQDKKVSGTIAWTVFSIRAWIKWLFIARISCLTSGKSVYMVIFLCSAQTFSNLCCHAIIASTACNGHSPWLRLFNIVEI